MAGVEDAEVGVDREIIHGPAFANSPVRVSPNKTRMKTTNTECDCGLRIFESRKVGLREPHF